MVYWLAHKVTKRQPIGILCVYLCTMRLLIIILLMPMLVNGQKWIGADSSPVIDQKEARLLELSTMLPHDTSALKEFLLNEIPNLRGGNSDLVLSSFTESPKAKHYHFTQTLNDRKVFRGSVKLNLSNNGSVLSVFDHTFPTGSVSQEAFPNHEPFHNGLMIHYETPSNGRLHDYKLEEVFFFTDGILEPAIRLEVVELTDRYYELVLNTDVKVIYQNDLLSYSAPIPQDSTVTLWVFNPDPLTSAGQTYGAPYVDASDADVLELNAERIPVEATATFDAGTFTLANEHVAIQELSLPDVQPITSTTPEFNFTRAESGFEDANAFYHITAFHEYIQSLGFSDIVDYQISVDVHALNGADNSNFNPGFNPPRLQFGEGGVDDAEDADVIIHEYGHAIMHSAAPNTNNGTERKALDEAVGDYFASSYSRFLSPNRWQDVFTWDGHNEYWPGRSTESSDHYPEDLNSNIYTDADIWAATLMQIWGDIGREATDAIMIQAAYSFSEGMTMPQAAYLFLQADTLLFNGANFTPIRQRMFDRGLIPWNVGVENVNPDAAEFEVFNTVGFASGTEPLRVVAERGFVASLYNAVGQLIWTKESASGLMDVNSEGISSGVYLLEVQTENSKSTVKLIRN